MDLGEVAQMVLLSLYVSALPALFCTALGLPLSAALYFRAPRAGRIARAVFNGFVGLPTVLLGLLLYLLLSRRGPLGSLNLLFTPEAMVLGHTLLVFPLYMAFSITALERVSPRIKELALTLGLSSSSTYSLLAREAVPGLVAASVSAFSRALGELGVALVLGGDIRYRTRVLTTAIAFDTLLGRWEEALALGLILLAISLATSLALSFLTHEAKAYVG